MPERKRETTKGGREMTSRRKDPRKAEFQENQEIEYLKEGSESKVSNAA